MDEEKIDEEKKDLEKQLKFMQILKDLAVTQTTLAKIDAQLAITRGKDQINEVINDTKTRLEQKAKSLGANMKKIEEQYIQSKDSKKGILDKYKESLEGINQEYDKILQAILAKKEQDQIDEQKAMLGQKRKQRRLKVSKKDFEKKSQKIRNEIIKATKEGNLELVQQKVNELKELSETHEAIRLEKEFVALQTQRKDLRTAIEKDEKDYEDTLNKREEKINELTGEKEKNELTKVPKQNIFKKLMGALFYKFNGTKTFVKTSIKPLMEKIENIENNELPKICEDITNKRTEFAKTVQTNKEKIAADIKNKVNEYKGLASQTKEELEKLRNDAIEFAKQTGKSVKDVEKMFKITVKEYAGNVKDTLIDKKDEVVNDVVGAANAVVKFGKDTKEKGQTTYRSIINKGSDAKKSLIDKMNKILINKQIELAFKRPEMEGQHDKSDEESRD